MFDLCDLLNIIFFDRPAILCCVPVRMIHYITTATLGYELVLGTSWHGTTWLGYELTGNPKTLLQYDHNV